MFVSPFCTCALPVPVPVPVPSLCTSARASPGCRGRFKDLVRDKNQPANARMSSTQLMQAGAFRARTHFNPVFPSLPLRPRVLDFSVGVCVCLCVYVCVNFCVYLHDAFFFSLAAQARSRVCSRSR